MDTPGSTVRPSPPTTAPRPSQNTNLQTKNKVNLQVAQGNTNPKCVDGQAKQTILNYVRNALSWAPLFVQGVAMGFVERVLLTAEALRHPLRTARQLVGYLVPVVGKLRLLWSWIQEYLRLGTAIRNFDTYEIGRMTGEAIFTLVFGVALSKITLAAKKTIVRATPWFKSKQTVSPSKPPFSTGKAIITPEMETKILYGQRKANSSRVIGGHSPGINNANPNFAVEVIRVFPDGTRKVKFYTQFSDGRLSALKTSTIFPASWSDAQIINAIKQVGNGRSIGFRTSDGATLFRSTVNGVQIEVIKIGDHVIAAYPTGGGAAGLTKGFTEIR